MAKKQDIPEGQMNEDPETGLMIYGPQVEGIADPYGGPDADQKPSLNTDYKNWQKVWKVGKHAPRKFDDAAKGRLLAVLAQCGRPGTAARAADVTPQHVNRIKKEDPAFAEAYEDALNEYRDTVMRVVQQDGLEGIVKPIFAGKDGDLKAFEVVKNTALIQMEARRVIPDYKDKKEVDVTSGGKHVAFPVAVPGMSLEEMAEGYEYPTEPPDPDAPIGTEIK